ncbi:hypothetical protein IFM89_003477 [Coptis chinensis]|uniref:Non-specific lipid-transfer protein n=1 Tax=Coptis chinensis TaxID=261450 RepID=A0A835LI73_9MAGN|nr:hypothetical protein IFM89_003477 [Coptis chinensis]
MACPMILKLTFVVLACMVVSAPYAEAAISCGFVVSKVSPCIPYLRGGGPIPPACCNGVRTLNAAAQGTPDRQTACNCLKQAAAGISGINPGFAGGLPGRCGVSIPYKISPYTDCSSMMGEKVAEHPTAYCLGALRRY